MSEKIIRFKSSPRIAVKIDSVFPNSRYHNKLYNSLKTFAELNELGKDLDFNEFSSSKIFDITKNDINTMFILRNCNLLNFPIRLGSNKFVETDYIEPYWDESVLKNSPEFTMTSKKYILLDLISPRVIKFIEYKRFDAYKNGKNVKVYEFELPDDIQILYENV